MKIALAQMNPTVGALAENASKMRRFAEDARREGAHLLLFPELALVGYPPRDLLERPSFLRSVEAAEAELVRSLPAELTVVFGQVGASRNGPGLANQAVVTAGGAVHHRHDKSLLPTYDVFDEDRYFRPGTGLGSVHLCGQEIALSVCEDLWARARSDAPTGAAPGRPYAQDPLDALAGRPLQGIINLSASPWSQHKEAARHPVLQDAAARTGGWVAYVNQVGAQDGLIFDGRSRVVAPDGRVLGQAPAWEEALLVVDLDAQATAVKVPAPVPAAELRQALVLGIRDYFQKTGLSRAVVGLSGGIDSAVTAALAAEALGPEQLHSFALPSPYSSQGALDDAEALARALGCPITRISITEGYRALQQSLAPVFGPAPQNLADENLQARLRGLLLMGAANHLGAAVLVTGNKSEMAMGYTTLYGDTCGAIAVLGDLYKHEVYALARHINEARPIIPQNSIDKAPSAELRPDQKDEDSLPPYPVLDAILKAFLEERQSAEEIEATLGFDRALIEDVIRRTYAAEFKRKQSPFCLRVSGKAWVGRDYPIAQRFRA